VANLAVQHNFSLFQSHLDLAHSWWERLLLPGDYVIDATCGNGHDTLKLAKILKGKGGVIGIDIQKEAIARAKELLKTHLPEEELGSVHLFEQSHAEFPPLAFHHPIRLIAYNLGYLPHGDKQRTTMTATTLASVRLGLDLISAGGAVSITCYPGHPEGAREELALQELACNLPKEIWNVCLQTFPNRLFSPSLLLIQKSLTSFPVHKHSIPKQHSE
jgi:SAM-dependent methyltransferase